VKVDGVGSNYCALKVGDFFEVENDAIKIPDGKNACIWSLSSLLPFLSMFKRAREAKADSVRHGIHFTSQIKTGKSSG
jgi:uncharacterized repeat protein (TIGR04076 family)